MAKTIPFSQARSELTKLLDELAERHEHFVITRNGLPAAVILSPDEYAAIQETLEILQDPDTMASLRQSEEDVRAGRLKSWSKVKRDRGIA